MKRTSLKDIATELDVSITTVSFVLNGKGKEKGISDVVIQKIQEYVKEINYKPNEVARTLRTGESRVLVFMVEDISNIFFATIARLIEDIAYEKGYRILFCSNENDDLKSEELLDLFVELQVEGFIVIPSPNLENGLEKLMQADIPLVLFDRYFPGLDSNYVVINNEESTYIATNHLLSNGFRNIAFVTIESQQTQMKDRLKGYQKALQEQELPQNVVIVPFNDPKKKAFLKKFLCGMNGIDAVFFSTNYLTELGLEVMKETDPERMDKWGILTFDDNNFFNIYCPSITAIAQPLEEISEQLMEILLNQIKNKRAKPQKRILETQLIVRESSLKRIP